MTDQSKTNSHTKASALDRCAIGYEFDISWDAARKEMRKKVLKH